MNAKRNTPKPAATSIPKVKTTTSAKKEMPVKEELAISAHADCKAKGAPGVKDYTAITAQSPVGARALGLPMDPVLIDNATQAKHYFEWMLVNIQENVDARVVAIYVAGGSEDDLGNDNPVMQVRLEGEEELEDLEDFVRNNLDGNPNMGDDLGDCLHHAKALVSAESEFWIGEGPLNFDDC